MRIKLLTNVYGNWRGNKGDIVDRPDAEAQYLISHRQAVAVPPAPTPAPAEGPIDPIAPAKKTK